MSSAGQILVGLSGLSGISAGQHLLGITAGTGGPSTTIYAPRMTVTTTTEKLYLTQKPKKQAQQVVEAPAQQGNPKSKNAYVRTSIPQLTVLTSPDEIWVRTTKETF